MDRVNLSLKINSTRSRQTPQTNDEITRLIRYHSASTRQFSLPEKLLQVNYVYGEREGNLPRQCTQRDSQHRQEARLLLVLSYIFRNKQIFPPTLFPSTAARTTKRTALFSLPFTASHPRSVEKNASNLSSCE